MVLHKKHNCQSNESTGTTLIKLLKNKPGCEFVYMIGSYNQAMKKVRLHNRFWTKIIPLEKESQTKPVVSNDGDIIAPEPKGSMRKEKQNTQECRLVVSPPETGMVLHKKHNCQSNESTGTTLIKLHKNKPGCEFVYMIGSYNQAMKKVRLHNRYGS